MVTPLDPSRDPEAERKRIIRGRNYALAAALVVMVVLFYLITIARIGG
jgi:hypothetical protein